MKNSAKSWNHINIFWNSIFFEVTTLKKNNGGKTMILIIDVKKVVDFFKLHFFSILNLASHKCTSDLVNSAPIKNYDSNNGKICQYMLNVFLPHWLFSLAPSDTIEQTSFSHCVQKSKFCKNKCPPLQKKIKIDSW